MRFSIPCLAAAALLITGCITTATSSRDVATPEVAAYGVLNNYQAVQRSLEHMVTHPKVSHAARVRLRALDDTLRQSVTELAVAARDGDQAELARLLPSVGSMVSRQTRVLSINSGAGQRFRRAQAATDHVAVQNRAPTIAEWDRLLAALERTGIRIAKAAPYGAAAQTAAAGLSRD